MAVEVLIVDDSDDFRFLLRRRLVSYGCEVVAEATNAREGLALFRAKRPRLVTLDLMMPDAPEFVAQDLFRQIRRESPQTAIVIVSVQRAGSNASNFLSEGALAYWEKAFLNFDDVRRRLSHVFPDLTTPLPSNHSSLAQRIRGPLSSVPSQRPQPPRPTAAQ
jgi:DNA-binding NarL/FixJ family response regulator